VNRTRAKQYGLNLTDYALGTILSPEVSPGATTTTTGGSTGGTTPGRTPTTTTTSSTAGRSTPPTAVLPPPPFNLNTISRGVTTSDFYLAVPAAIVRFLESDTSTKLIAKPQLRGAEGKKLTYKVGDRVPVITTAFTPIAGGGASVNPLSTYNYQDVGVNLDLTPRVTQNGDIILDLTVDNSSLGASISVAGQSVPSFGQRNVTTTLRLRDGESNLLAGLLRDDERKALTGFPGAIHVPVLQQLFSANDQNISQTDIVMLLTPHILRTNEITVEDLKPIYIGSQQNLGLGGAPALIAPPEAPPAEPVPPLAPPATVPGPTTAPPVTTAGIGSAQVILTPPGTAFRVGGGPYTVPISVVNVSRLSTITLTLTFDPALLRVRTVQEGSFMRSGGANATFVQQQTSPGRVDITITRSTDATGASGTGLLGAVLFDAIASGNATLSLSGVATGPGGTAMGLQFRPVTVNVQQ
jgi:general secretion pathway protein D